jgi:prepilin-type N-terminal cleavage/methylation domain-containing protein
MRKGFTLIEIVMVILILGILSAIAIPVFFDLSHQAEASFSKQFEGALKEAYTNYILRLALEGKPSIVSSFNAFVDFSGNASPRNTIKIDNSIRTALADPNATVGADTTITFNFKSGASAVYTFDPATQRIQEQYTP